jgi:hypothetical protein
VEVLVHRQRQDEHDEVQHALGDVEFQRKSSQEMRFFSPPGARGQRAAAPPSGEA